MRARFEIENSKKLKAGVQSKLVITSQGAVLGASQDADWVLQDVMNTIPDFLARIEVLDNRYIITAFPGAKVFLNGSSSPLRANRQVFLRSDDKVGFGELKLRMREVFIEDEQTDYIQLDDAVEVSSRVTKNSGYRDLIDAEAIVVEEPKSTLQPWTDRNQWDNRRLVSDHRKDPLYGLQDDWSGDDDQSRRSPLIATPTARESEPDTFVPFYKDRKSSAKNMEAQMTPVRTQKDRFGFNEIEDATEIEAIAEEQKPVDEIVAGNQLLVAISQNLGIPVGELAEEDITVAVGEMAESLRISVEGIHAIYRQSQTTQRSAFSQFNRNAIDDNPLRFSQDAEGALRTMFLERSEVHLAPAAALQESLNDLRQHQIATEGAIEQGLLAMMEAFRPDNLENRFQSYKRAEIPPEGEARDAWNWRRFEAYFDELKSHRQSSMTQFFWEIFNNAYQENMRSKDRNVNPVKEGDNK